MKSIVCYADSIALSTIVLMARVQKSDGTNMVQTDVSSIRVDLYDLADEFSQPQLSSTGTVIPPTVRTPVNASGVPITDGSAYDTPAATNVVYNALQTDARWSVDSTGYNVAYKLATPLTDHIYEARITFNLTNEDTIVLVYQIASK